jgi:hypothetical protein
MKANRDGLGEMMQSAQGPPQQAEGQATSTPTRAPTLQVIRAPSPSMRRTSPTARAPRGFGLQEGHPVAEGGG